MRRRFFLQLDKHLGHLLALAAADRVKHASQLASLVEHNRIVLVPLAQKCQLHAFCHPLRVVERSAHEQPALAVSLPAVGGHLAARLSGPEAAGAFSPLVLVGYALGLVYVVGSLRALRAWPIVGALALAAAVGLVISPHAWVYDGTFLLPAIGLFAVAADRRGWPWQDRWLLAAAYGLALLWPLGGIIGVASPLIVVLIAPAVLLGWGPMQRFGVAPGQDEPLA